MRKDVLACLLSRRWYRCDTYVSDLYRGRSVGSEKTMDESVSEKFDGRAIPPGNYVLGYSRSVTQRTGLG